MSPSAVFTPAITNKGYVHALERYLFSKRIITIPLRILTEITGRLNC